jgi:hypothetical protein
MLKEVMQFHWLLGPRRVFTARVHMLLMVGGTLLMLLALQSGMQSHLTCAASLWSVAGFYGFAQLLRTESQAAVSGLGHLDAAGEARFVET